MNESDRSRATNGATRILPRLWMGPIPPTGDGLHRAGFDVLVLCAAEWQPPERAFPGVGVLRCKLDDSGVPATEKEVCDARAAGKIVAYLVGEGRRVVVTCAQGRNRSGLVAALAVHHLHGLDGLACREWVRRRRGDVLLNPYFNAVLRGIQTVRKDASP